VEVMSFLVTCEHADQKVPQLSEPADNPRPDNTLARQEHDPGLGFDPGAASAARHFAGMLSAPFDPRVRRSPRTTLLPRLPGRIR
ncbi:MAG: hypothetical protein AAFN70_11110, partial [Planctomycetota bacterium]